MTGANAIGRRRALGAGAMAGAVLLAGINDAARAEGDPIPVGQAAALTGYAAVEGVEYRNGLILACDEINALGGILGRPLRPVIEDTGDMGDDAVALAVRNLVNNGAVHAVIDGANAGGGTVEHGIAADAGIVLVQYNSVQAHNDLVRADPARYATCFQGAASRFWYGPGLLAFVDGLERSGQYKRANGKLAVIGGPDAQGSSVADAIKAKAGDYGWAVTVDETMTPASVQWAPILEKIRQDPPAVIAITQGVAQDQAQFMLQFVTNPTPSLVYMHGGTASPAFRSIAGAAATGVLHASLAAALQDELGTDFERRYKSRFGSDAGHLTGALTYDATWLWATAAAIAGGTAGPGDGAQNRRVADRMRSQIWRGVCGVTRFVKNENVAYTFTGQTGDASLGLPLQYFQVQDYKRTPIIVGPDPYANGKFMTPPWLKT